MQEPHASVIVPVGAVDDDVTTALDAVLGQATSFPFEVVLSVNTRSNDARGELDRIIDDFDDKRLRTVDSSQAIS